MGVFAFGRLRSEVSIQRCPHILEACEPWVTRRNRYSYSQQLAINLAKALGQF
jgi:hypothetical protein